MLKPTRAEPLIGFHSHGKLLALSANIGLGWKCMAVANTLVYCDWATITAVKSFIVQALGVNLMDTHKGELRVDIWS